MKQRFRARELWLFAPFLLILAGAFYWARVEKVSKPGASGMFVSEFKVEAAPGYWQERGFSHQIVTTVSHPWPRPKWWGQHYGKDAHYVGPVDALAPEKSSGVKNGVMPAHILAEGIALTVERNGKAVPVTRETIDDSLHFRFDGKHYIFTNYVKLSSITPSQGAVTMRGACYIEGQPHFAFRDEIRKAGEILPMVPDKNPRAQLLEISARLSEDTRYQVDVLALIRRDEGVGRNQILCPVYDLEIVDGIGKIYPLPDNNIYVGLSAWGGGYYRERENQLARNEFLRYFYLKKDGKGQMWPPLKLRGKISVNDAWPIPFEVKLPSI